MKWLITIDERGIHVIFDQYVGKTGKVGDIGSKSIHIEHHL